MNRQSRQAILARDGNRCRACGADEHLEVHHIVTREECRWLKLDRDVLEHPNNLITLCQRCGSLALFGPPHYLLESEDREELKVIKEKRRKFLQDKKELKDKYYRMWNTVGYRERKRAIDRSLEECRRREEEIKRKARVRKGRRRKEVLDTIFSFKEVKLPPRIRPD